MEIALQSEISCIFNPTVCRVLITHKWEANKQRVQHKGQILYECVYYMDRQYVYM